MGAPEQLQIDLERQDDRVVVHLDGELDMANAGALRAALEEIDAGAEGMVVLNLQKLRFIDSTGLRVILWARERYVSRGLEFAVTPGSQQVQRLLAVSGAGEHLRSTGEI